ncbi:MAG: alkaline phosphatase family protein [Bacteroidaceae bacterium]|nr:alkaline phosphatase family protein [Bacteroidaceae bacterium]
MKKKDIHSLLFRSAFLLTVLFLGNIAGRAQTKIVVGIVVDQLRSDYMERYQSLFGSGGFKRLMNDGLVYTNGTYNYVSPDRSSATATIYSGTEPAYHGIVGNKFMDRSSLKVRSCVDDSSCSGVNTFDGSSPQNLLVTTIADELKIATRGQSLVFSVAPDRDMAVLAGGHAADAVLWMDDVDGRWASSSFYGETPRWLNTTYMREKMRATTFESSRWTPFFPVTSYIYPLSEGKPQSFGYSFSTRDARLFKTSGLINDQITDMAKVCLAASAFGRDNTPDLLCVGYYAGNYEHRSESEAPIELQDIYCRLDRTIADLIQSVEARVGEGNALFFLTSTGYSDVHQPAVGDYHLPSGEVRMERYNVLLNMYLGAIYGKNEYVDASYLNQIFLNHSALERFQIKMSDVQDRCVEFLTQVKGIKHVYGSMDLMGNKGDDAIRNAYHNERSGDIILEIAPGWSLADSRWGEVAYYSRALVPVPIIFFGKDIRHEVSSAPTPVESVAPTVAALLNIGVPNACSLSPLSY